MITVNIRDNMACEVGQMLTKAQLKDTDMLLAMIDQALNDPDYTTAKIVYHKEIMTLLRDHICPQVVLPWE